MGSPVFTNKQGWSHKGSNATATNTAPDVCLTQVGNSIAPIPYPNTAKSSDLKGGSKTVQVNGHSAAIDGCCYSKSAGDEAGNRKGVMSGTHKGKAEFTNYSYDVKCEGKGVCRNADSMMLNNGNTIGINNDVAADPPAPKIPPPPKDTVRSKIVKHLSWDNYDRKERRFKLGHEDNKPVAGRKFKIKMPDGSIVEKATDDEGIIEMTGQDPHGRFEFIFEPEEARLNNKNYLFSNAIAPLKRKI